MKRIFLAPVLVAAVFVLPAGATTKLHAPAVTIHPTFYAVVAGDGTLARSNGGAITSSHLGTGDYEVDFPRDVHTCWFNATSATTSTGSQPNIIVSVAVRSGNPKGVFVGNTNNTGANTDSSFHLLVTCP